MRPAWNLSNIGSRRTTQPSTFTSTGRHTGSTPRHEHQPEGRRSRPATEPDSPEHVTKLKSAVVTTKDKAPDRTSYERMGPAARSRYEDPGSSRDSDREGRKVRDNKDRRTREKSRQRSDSDRHRESRSQTGSSRREESRSHSRYQESRPKDRNSGRTQSRPTEKRGFDKSATQKEYEERYDKIVTHPRKYLEERYPQINPEFYRAEVHAMRYFGPTAEEATIQVLTLIDWAAEYMKLSNSPVPDILAFLQSPFVAGGTAARNPMPTDPAVNFRRDIDIRTKSHLTWLYLCALLQAWTDEATVAEGGLYGGKRRPTNPLVGRIRAVINPFADGNFEVTWESIEAWTSWTRARWYFGSPDKTRFESEAAPTSDLKNHLEKAMETRWQKMKEGPREGDIMEFASPTWSGAASRPYLPTEVPTGVPEPRHPTVADSVPPGFTPLSQKTREEQEATQKYQTERGEERMKAIDKELGFDECTKINEDWYQQTEVSETELKTAVEALTEILDEAQPMDVDPNPESSTLGNNPESGIPQEYNIFDSRMPDLLNEEMAPVSPVTSKEDKMLDSPATSGFSRAPGDGRPPPVSSPGQSGRKITGRPK